MRQSKKHLDTRHKEVHSGKKKAQKIEYKLDKPIKSDISKQDWQIEAEYLKKRHRDQIR